MDIKTRLFRRPFTTILWSVLVIAMTLLIGVGCVLNYSAQNLLPMLDENHTAVALRTDRASESIVTEHGAIWTYEPKMFVQDDLDFFIGLDSVENVYFHPLTGAYCPELMPALALTSMYGNYSDCYGLANESYDQIIFVGTVLRILEESEITSYDMSPIGHGTEEPHQTITAEIRIDQILSAHPDYPFFDEGLYNGVVNCQFFLYGEGALEYIGVGSTYLLSGEYDPQVVTYQNWPEGSSHPSMRTAIYNVWENGILYGYRYGVSYPDMKAADVVVHPTASKLDGPVEDFLKDPDNADWTAHLKTCSVAQHNLPVMGTDALRSIYQFLSGNAYIVDGRMFSEEEYASGSRVCIISETVATRSDIRVGDTIHLSQFPVNETYNTSIQNDNIMLNNPTVGETMAELEFFTENEEFTVIGIYRQSNEWEQTSYSFTPNTVFIPRKAQIPGGFGNLSVPSETTLTLSDGTEITSMVTEERGSYGVFFSILLRNGTTDDFLLSISGTDWEDQFHTFDMGYDAVIRILNGVAESARNLLLFTTVGWVMLLALYVLLYQNSQRKNLGVMRSLGAKPKQAMIFLFGSGFGLASVCVVIGTALTAVVSRIISDKLLELIVAEVAMEHHSAGMEIHASDLTRMIRQSQLPAPVLLLLAGIQLLVLAAVLWLHAASLAKKAPRKLMGV